MDNLTSLQKPGVNAHVGTSECRRGGAWARVTARPMTRISRCIELARSQNYPRASDSGARHLISSGTRAKVASVTCVRINRTERHYAPTKTVPCPRTRDHFTRRANLLAAQTFSQPRVTTPKLSSATRWRMRLTAIEDQRSKWTVFRCTINRKAERRSGANGAQRLYHPFFEFRSSSSEIHVRSVTC